MRTFTILVGFLAFNTAGAINQAGESCFKTSKGKNIVQKVCNGIEIKSSMCAADVGEVDTILDSFAPLVDTWLSTDSKACPECRDFWSSRCEAIGGTVKSSVECKEVCAALETASVRCIDDQDCENELIWKIPVPLPSVRESVSLSIGLACCDWVESTLNSVCENINATALAEFLSVHTTADVAGNCRESTDGVECGTPVISEAGGCQTSSAAEHSAGVWHAAVAALVGVLASVALQAGH